jgi:hypothetical protein
VLEWGKDLAVVSLPHAAPLLSSTPCGTASPAAALPALLEGGTFVIKQDGCRRLEFLETYDKSWNLVPTSPGARVTSHTVADHFYNQWTVTGPATAVYALRYSGASSFLEAFVGGALIGVAYLGCVFGTDALLRRRGRIRWSARAGGYRDS